MNKNFKDNGFLSEDGKRLVEHFVFGLAATLMEDEVNDMSEAELLTLGSNLAKLVGDIISNKIQAKNDLKKKFSEMSDEQFEAYMKTKYGDRWMLMTITNEEFARLRPVSDKQIRDAFEQGLKDRDAAVAVTSSIFDSGLRYK